LLQKQFSGGHRLGTRPTLAESRERLRQAMGGLEQRYKDLMKPDEYPVKYTPALNAMAISERVRSERRQD